jgi:hypothetical protein
MEPSTHSPSRKTPWNKGKLVGQKVPLKLKDIWAIRVRLHSLPHLSTRQYARIVRGWIREIGLDASACGTHTLRANGNQAAPNSEASMPTRLPDKLCLPRRWHSPVRRHGCTSKRSSRA